MADLRRCLQLLLSSLFSGERLRLRLSPDASSAALSAHSGNQIQLLAQFQSPEELAAADVAPPRHLPVEILLPNQLTLRRTLDIPRSALRNPRRAAFSAIDRMSPGAANGLYFDIHPTAGLAADDHVRLELLMASREPIEIWLRSLKRKGYRVRAVTAEDGWGGNNLLPTERRARDYSRPSLHTATSLALLALLFTVAWNIPLWKHASAIGGFESQAAAFMPDAEAAEELLGTLRQRTDGFEDLIAERQSSRPLVDILLELTNLHSDGSWVRSLKISAREIEIRGETRDAAALVTQLERSPMFENTELHGPVVKIRGSFYETYHIRMRLAERQRQ